MEKKTYNRPSLTDYGTIADLTRLLVVMGGGGSIDVCSSHEHDWCHMHS